MKYDYLIDRSFPPAMRYGAYLVLAVALFSLYYNPIMAALIALAAAFVAFADTRVRFDPGQMRYQSHNNFLGIRLGTWHSLKAFKGICILKSTLKTQAYSRTLQTSETSSTKYYSLYLLNENHRVKVLVARCRSAQEAGNAAEELSEALKLPVVPYRPKISQQSRARRQR